MVDTTTECKLRDRNLKVGGGLVDRSNLKSNRDCI